MQSLWSDKEAASYQTALQQRVYSSQLLGRDPALVLHGGGNTSVKQQVVNLFGETEHILYVKGSGWDLATIEAPGFAPVRMQTLLKMAALEQLSDSDMVTHQRAAMIDPSAPNPSVEAILHAIIPYLFVDHSHADAVVTLSNTAEGEALIRAVYGERVLVVPYVMPGFELAQRIYQLTRTLDWQSIEGIVLMNHGLFTFADDARTAYEKHIELVTEAEIYLEKQGATLSLPVESAVADLLSLAKIRRAVCRCYGQALIAHLNDAPLALAFSQQDLAALGSWGTLTPEHIIRTKRAPLFVQPDPSEGAIDQAVADYAVQYRRYFDAHQASGQICLNPAPSYAVWAGRGALSFGKSLTEAQVIRDINDHTFEAILKAEQLGGYQALDEATLFAIEYWELEQAKLRKGGSGAALSGKIALLSGAATALGQALERQLQQLGATVVALNDSADIDSMVRIYGGLDLLVLAEPIDAECYAQALTYLQLGIDPLLCCIGEGPSYPTTSGVRVLELEASDNVEGIAALVSLLGTKQFADQRSITLSF